MFFGRDGVHEQGVHAGLVHALRSHVYPVDACGLCGCVDACKRREGCCCGKLGDHDPDGEARPAEEQGCAEYGNELHELGE